jgi:hypothetical protein
MRMVENVTCMGEMEIRIKFWSETLNANQDIDGKILLNGTSDGYGLRVNGQKINSNKTTNQMHTQL